MKREDAIKKLCEYLLVDLDEETRAEDVRIWFLYDFEKGDEILEVFSKDLQKELIEKEEVDNPLDEKYNILLIQDLISKFDGVKNEYIKMKLTSYNYEIHKIEGKEEEFLPCPCCSYKTLSQRYHYEICPICFWEDEYVEDENEVSSANNLTLKEAKKNFKEFKACEKRLLKYTDKEGEEKYFK